ncbi:signal peptidase I [uncultured Salinisphaera sp.]|uniref:signal peptidase I n=1 Tax=uncultured Salinisphaera sp. TaxID=359372 RepID=UPI0032B11C35|tara:strand:- start:31 stop:795 length:765 start_codon:yes stop_codon:yes gene_type:complete
MDFEAWLTLACAVTGALWIGDKLVWSKRRGDGERGNWAIEFAHSFFPVLIAVLVLRAFVFEPFRIPSKSMVPTLLVGDFVLVSKFAYGLRLPVTHTKIVPTGEPARGDVVVFRYPENPSVDYIKRIIGLPGDTITYRDEQLYVNGQAVPRENMGFYDGPDAELQDEMRLFIERLPDAEPHEMLHVVGRNGPEVSVTVPEGHYFAMGDNRDNSADSRIWGFVPEANLVGQAFMIWLSVNVSDFDIRFSRMGTWLN